ncbi:MAG: alanine racemase [Actinomycetota bacterium]|nr:alanine racemase [Actinomycetota bacterium]
MESDKKLRNAWAEIDLGKLEHNLEALKSLYSDRLVNMMAIVKADAYGHGAVPVAQRALAKGAYGLGVALVQEGRQLRQKGIDAPILVLSEVPLAAVDQALGYHLIPAISSLEKARAFNDRAAAMGCKARCHLNIDTGMNRLGFDYRKAPEQIKEIASLPHLEVEGLFTHFACASDSGSDFTPLQLERFKQVLAPAKTMLNSIKFIHAANSAACIENTAEEFNMVRVGLAMYGLNPFSTECSLDLSPVLSLKARVAFIKEVAAGDTISYCRTHKVKQKSTIAVLPIGYADGYSRLLSNRARVITGGEYAPVVGNVTMDQCMVDITGLKVSLDDEAILIGTANGKCVTADQLAHIMGTINYEIVCMIGSRIPRIYIN